MILNADQPAERWGLHGRRVLGLLATNGPASRERLHSLSGLHRSLVGETVRRLMDDGLVRFGEPRIKGRGRPQTPIALDPARRTVLGMAIDPGEITTCRVNLLGNPTEAPAVQALDSSADPIKAAATLIRRLADPSLLAISISVTGVVDVTGGVILESSALPGTPVDLRPLRKAAGDIPLVLENDLHALAQHWRMLSATQDHEDVLLVRFEDGAVGAALIVQGRPHVGCVHAASEIGHTRLAVQTRRCYCGRRGCLERVFDSRFAFDQDGDPRTMTERVAGKDRLDDTMARIIDLLGMGIANAAQLTKPHRLVLVSRFAQGSRLRRRLLSVIRREMLASLRERIKLEWCDEPPPDRAVAAAQPALAMILGACPGQQLSAS